MGEHHEKDKQAYGSMVQDVPNEQPASLSMVRPRLLCRLILGGPLHARADLSTHSAGYIWCAAASGECASTQAGAARHRLLQVFLRERLS